MSFILDALKKSEMDRQKQANPGLDLGVPKTRATPRWAIALAVLLGVNLLILLVFLVRNSPTNSSSNLATHEAVVSANVAAPTSAHFSPLNAPVYAPEIPLTSPLTPIKPLAQSKSLATFKPPASKPLPMLLAEDSEEILPSINELHLTGAQSLPDLHLDVHVFATQARERFVYINMRKYKEGATLQEGPLVTHIRRDGVVLDFHGLKFLLPRQ